MLIHEVANPILYHGTTDSVLPAIQREGLIPRPSHDNPNRIGIYLTNDLPTAEGAAEVAWDRRGGKPVILWLRMSDLDSRNFEPDDYDLQNMIDDLHAGDEQLSGRPHDQRLLPYTRWDQVPWQLSLAVCEAVVYTKPIAPRLLRVLR